jgi:hypothetical protein
MHSTSYTPGQKIEFPNFVCNFKSETIHFHLIQINEDGSFINETNGLIFATQVC